MSSLLEMSSPSQRGKWHWLRISRPQFESSPRSHPGETLDFQIVLDTHSADLSMNLAELATLTTDTGKTVQAITWEAPLGGHHVEGTLSFPAAVDNAPLLEEAATFTLTIVNLDTLTRTFVWER